MKKIESVLLSEQVSSNSVEAGQLFEKSRFGEKIKDKLIYMLEETFFLVEENKMEVLSSSYKKIDKEKLLKKLVGIDKRFLIKYAVYRDLRRKGYIVKSALKFGADFRVYDKGAGVGKSHSKWICFANSENKSFTWQDFAAKNRVAHSTKKNLLVGIVDQENDVSYYEVSWKRVV